MKKVRYIINNFKTIILISIFILVSVFVIQDLTRDKNVYILKLTDNEFCIFDNITGYPIDIVPNIVHYVLFGINEIQFGHYISILSVLKNQKPDLIMIHCDCQHLVGHYWQTILNLIKNTKTKIEVRKVEKMTEIFGHKLNEKWINWHLSDIMRNKVLREFGGIYLDRDVYVVKSLDVFRKYEMTLGWDEGQSMGSQIQIAHKNARFLKLFYETYRYYDPNRWYYNAGELPTKAILHKMPHLVHRVINQFGVDGPVVCPKVYKYYYPDWQKDFYTIHLILRGNEISFKDWCFGKESNYPEVVKFDEFIATKLSVTFGEMTRLLLDNQSYIDET